MAKIPVRSSTAKNPEPIALDLPSDENSDEKARMQALGFTDPGAPPGPQSSMPDLLLHALVPYRGMRPEHGIVLGVAAELSSLAMFIEGPLSIALEMLERRLRVAVDLGTRASDAAPPGSE